MANIKVNNLSSLNIVGADLFNDIESFMTELSDESEQMKIIGACQATSPRTACDPRIPTVKTITDL